MAITPHPDAPKTLIKPRITRSAWVRDFAFIRQLALTLLKFLRMEVDELTEAGEEIAQGWQAKRLFGPSEPLADSLVKLSAMLLKWHEHDRRRIAPEERESLDDPLQEDDVEIVRRYLERRGLS